jgi:uncharacterized repeat protein (TIGR02543 family)
MKRFYLILSLAMIALTLSSQTPQGINYQTVVRDEVGNILANQGVSVQLTIRAGAPDGETVYTETHDALSNGFGLVNLVIGLGTPVTGSFSAIQWGTSTHFLETAVGMPGSKNFQVLGITQFLSVPYAQFSGVAGGNLTLTSQQRNELENPPTGMVIFNTTTKCLNYYDGSHWNETCGSQVIIETFTVTYNPNHPSAQGQAPVDPNEYEEGDVVTVLGKNTLSVAGFIFNGWNTSPNGAGNTYAENQTFTMPGNDVSLYAIWEEETIVEYCSFAANSGIHIHNFSTTGGTTNISNLNTLGSPGGYGDFTHMEVTVAPGGTFNFSVQGNGGNCGFTIWVDWNNDGDFDDPGETVWSSPAPPEFGVVYNGSVAATSSLGSYRMRVVGAGFTIPTNPCGTTQGSFGFGEAEDYTIVVSGAAPPSAP